MNLVRRSLETPELSLSYVEGPKSGPPLVWLHGVSGRSQRWRAHMEAFVDRWQVFALDARGHGRSGRTPGRYSWLDHARDLDAFLRAVLTEPAVLVGHSLGAMQVVKVAAGSPAAVACAVLVDPPLYARERPETDFTQFRLMEGAARSGMSVEQILALWAAPPWMSEALQREYVEGLMELDPENLTVTINLKAMRGFAVDEYLARIQCPTLVIRAGGEGGALPQADLDRGLSRLTRGLGVVIPCSGHQVDAEQSTAFRRALEDFLRARAV